MNVYDFDKTIYKRDSSQDFIIYCVLKKPILLVKLPGMLWAYIQYLRGKTSKDKAKEAAFSVIFRMQPIEKYVDDFWKTHKQRIAQYYLAQKKPNDVVISASPEFLLAGICHELGVGTLIASIADPKTGKWRSANCYGAEKVSRYREKMGNAPIDAFYSDSLSDTPLAELAEKAYLVKGEQLIPWDTYRKKREEK